MHGFKVIGLSVLLVSSSTLAQSLQLAELTASTCVFEGALEMLRAAPKAEQDSRRGLMLKARILVQLGSGTEAIAVLETLPASSDKGEEADRVLALALALSAANEIATSEKQLAVAEKLGADKAIVQGARGMLRFQEGKLDSAERELRRALVMDPTLSGAIFNLALIMGRRGHVAESAALVRQAWHLGYRDPKQVNKEQDLAAVRSTPGLINDLLIGVVPRCGTY